MQLFKHVEERGVLAAVNQIPFEAKRVFFISNVLPSSIRGNHFSRTSSFLYIVIKGGCKVELDDGVHKEFYFLDSNEALLFPKNIWMNISEFMEETVLCVLADMEYQSADYVSDYEELKRIAREGNV